MRKVLSTTLLLLIATSAFAQMGGNNQPSTVTSVLQSQLTSAEKQFTSAAEALPEGKYSFVPTQGEYEGVRTFAKLVSHTSAANYRYCSRILGEAPPVEVGGADGPDSLKTKAEIVKFMKGSFEYCHKAYGSIDAQNMVAPVKGPTGNMVASRLESAVANIAHVMDSYGQLVEYLRLNGIVPPTTVERQRR